MKYVILIHSNPQPWGHPTGDYLAEFQALPEWQRKKLNDDFERTLTELQRNGELVTGAALDDPASALLYRWRDGAPLTTDGPYAESKEQLAGLFLIDVESRERGEEVAAVFAGPGETVELRPVMDLGGEGE